MSIQVLNYEDKPLEVSKEAKANLAAIDKAASKPGADWDDISAKVCRALEKDGFTLNYLRPEISYYESKSGKQILIIKVYYENK